MDPETNRGDQDAGLLMEWNRRGENQMKYAARNSGTGDRAPTTPCSQRSWHAHTPILGDGLDHHVGRASHAGYSHEHGAGPKSRPAGASVVIITCGSPPAVLKNTR